MEIVSHEFFCFLLFFILAILLIAGYPVALTLAGVSILVGLAGYALDLFPIILLNVLPNRIFGIISNETLIAVPQKPRRPGVVWPRFHKIGPSKLPIILPVELLTNTAAGNKPFPKNVSLLSSPFTYFILALPINPICPTIINSKK